MRNLFGAALAACLLMLPPATAIARPFEIDDLLSEEAFGNTAVDPTGRWLIIERHDRYDSARRYDYAFENGTGLSRLLVEDLAHPGPARPLLRAPIGPGQTLAAFSPTGRRLAIYWLHGRRWTLGVVTLATGAVRWFPITPDVPDMGRGLQWLSDRELLVVDRPDGTQPWFIRTHHVSADELPKRWAATARGVGSVTVMGSGAWRGARDRVPLNQLVRLDVVSGRRHVLAEGENLDIELSPDRRRVALLSSGADIQPEAEQSVQGDWGIATQRQDLSIVDLATGAATRPCPDCDVLPHVVSWSPDGASLLVYARLPGGTWSSGHFRRIEAASGETRQVGRDLAPLIAGRPEVIWSGWMGRDPIIYARPAGSPTARLDWYRLAPSGPVNLTAGLPSAPRSLVALDDAGLVAISDHRLWRSDRDGAAQALDAPALDDSRPKVIVTSRREDVTPPQASWGVTQAVAGRRRVLRIDARGLVHALPLTLGDGRVVAVSERPDLAIVRETDPRGLETLSAVTASGAPLRITAVNTQFAAIDPPDVRAIAHKGLDGQPLTSWLYLPRRAPNAPPPPLVVRAYSGGQYATPPVDFFMPGAEVTHIGLLVGHGYAVLVPSLPLPKGTREPMAGLADRILGIVDQAAADPTLSGTFDPQRLGIWGHSYGSYTAQAAITQTDRFRAAVVISGSNDLIARWGTWTPPRRLVLQEGIFEPWAAGWAEFLQGGMGVPPWADPERYVRNSPLLAANRITTPLLLVAGDQDIAQPVQSELMFSALYRQNKDALLLTFWGETHAITSPGNVRRLWSTAFQFFDKAFRPAPSAAAPPSCREPVPASGAPTPPP